MRETERERERERKRKKERKILNSTANQPKIDVGQCRSHFAYPAEIYHTHSFTYELTYSIPNLLLGVCCAKMSKKSSEN